MDASVWCTLIGKVLLARDMLPLLSPTSRIEPALILKLLPPRLYMRLPLSLVLKLLVLVLVLSPRLEVSLVLLLLLPRSCTLLLNSLESNVRLRLHPVPFHQLIVNQQRKEVLMASFLKFRPKKSNAAAEAIA